MSNDLIEVRYEGITAVSDAAIYEPPTYGEDSTFILLNMYGSESQLRGIFSAIVGGEEITINRAKVSRNYYNSTMKFKSWKIGYGKYQAIIRDEKFLSECILSTGDALSAWDNFLKKRRIPYLREWIPPISMHLEREGFVEKLTALGLFSSAWYWKTSDDEVCDLIVREIYKAA
jgi:hypothetical protein